MNNNVLLIISFWQCVYIQRTRHPLASIWYADVYGPEGAS